MAINNSVTVDIKARADQASFKEVRKLFEQTIGDLETQKSNAIKMPGGGRAKEIKEEIDMVKKLQQAYENAYNHNYNNVNATQLSKNIKAMGVDVQKTGQIFRNLGVEGDRAFKTITSSVVSSNTQLQKTHTIFQDMMKTMGNTIKWGISSSLMNSFTGAVSEAYGYVKNLDKSLNDIRIVGGKSAKEMEQFAIHANKAAQALGSNTLDYTNASLIYYQQGLGDEQVKQMTDITVKMSNVLGTSAEEVSNYMTAIWNNFNDGSKSLEYYADVLTALGAATASSAEEISTGLEKFAAVADATGLSYEYATAALTTVTAKTRQSAEVVGTAFKTLFARIQDLELGNTLDDGTTLGKYSEALYKVGINIKDSNGEMKKMDDILYEMGKKWSTLGEAEKVALAQTVAGVRQYNQLMALMENWDYFQENLDTARNATGTLVDQQAIYMESTEAHLASAEAAWEDFKDSLLDESVINFFADLSKTIAGFGSHMLDSFGGGLPTLGLLGGIALKSSSATLGKTIYDSVGNRSKSRGGDQERQAREDERQMQKMFLDANLSEDQQSGLSAQYIANRKKEIETLNQYSQYMNEEQEEAYKNILKEKMAQEAVIDAWDQKIAKVKEYFAEVGTGANKELEGLTATDDIVEQQNAISALIPAAAEAQAALKPIREELEKITLFQESDLVPSHYMENIFGESTTMSMKNATAALEAPQAKGQELTSFWESSKKDNASLANIDRASVQEVENSIAAIGELDKAFKEAQKNGDKVFSEKAVIEYNKEVKKLHKNMVNALEDIETDAKEVVDTLSTADGASKADKARQSVDKLNTELNDMNTDLKDISKYDAFVNISGGALQAVSGVGALVNTFSILEDESLSSGEKIMQIFTGVLMSAMSLASGVKSIGDSLKDLGVSINLKDIHIPNFQEIGEGVQQFKEKTIALAEAKKKAELASKAAATGEKTLQTAQAATSATTTALAAGETAVAGGTAAAGGAAAAATAPTMTFSAALWSIAWPVLAVVAALALLIGGIALVVKAYNKDADAAKEAAEAAEHAKQAAEEATEAYNRLNEGMTKYKEGVDALKELTAGTEEYKEALDKANQAVMDLVKADASLAKYVKKRGELYVFEDEDGNDITDKLLKDAESRMNRANATANIAQIYANQTAAKSQRTNALRQADLHRGDKAAVGAAIGGTIGGLVTGGTVGTTAGAAIGASLGAANSLTDEQLQTVLQSITDNYGTLTRENLEKLSFLNEAEIDALMDNKASLEGLAKSTDELNATNKLLLEQSMSDALANNEIVTGAKNTDGSSLSDKQKNAISSLYSEGYTEEKMAEERKKLEDEWYKDKAFGGGNEDEVHAEYAKMMGYTLVDDKLGDKAVFATADGEEVTVSDDAMRAHIVNTKLAEQMDDYDSGNLQKLTNAVSSVDTSAFDNKYGINLDDAFFDAVASEGKFDFSSMFADISPSELAEMSNLSGEDWQQALGLTDEELATLGFDSAEDLAKGIEDGLTGWEWSPEAAINSLLNKNENAKKLEDQGVDTEQFKGYAEYLMNTAKSADNLADSLSEDADAAMTVTRGVMRMNNGIEKLSDGFEGWSDVLKKSDKTSEEYYDALTNMQDAMADLLDTEDKYVTDSFVQEHMEDIEKAAKGDEEAIDRLHTALAKDMVLNIATDNDIAQSEIDQFISTLDNLEIPDVKAGVKLDGTDAFAQELMKIVEDSKMTAKQAREFFGQMGFDAQFETKKETVTQSVPVTKTESTIDSIFPLKMTSKTYQDGVQNITQTVDVPSLSTEDGKPPKITLTKRADSSFSDYSSKNKGSAKKSGGGSKPKKEDLLKDVIDRYHDVNIELEEIGNSLDKAKKATERLVGQDLINNLADQYALLNKQIATTAEKINIAKGEMDELKGSLAGKGMQFSEDGSISNYASAYQAQMDYVNSLINQYNGMSQSQQEAFQDTLDKAKEDFEKFKEDIARYDELLTGEIPGLEGEIQDAILEQIALKLDAFHHEIEIRLNMAEAERDWNSFFNKVIKDIDESDILGNAEAKLEDFMSYYKDNMDGIIQTNAQHIQDILTDLRTMDEGGIAKYYGKDGVNDRTRALDDLKTYYEQLMSDLEAVHDLSDEIHESYVDMINEAQEKFDEQISTFETINNLIEHDKNVISMIYGEESYSALSQFYDRQEENYNKQLDFQKQQVEFWRMQMATAEEGSDAWNAAKENWLSAVDAWNGAIETAIQNLQDKYLNAINAIFQNLNNNVTNGMGLDFVETEWDLINQNADQYLDTVNAIYKVQELQNKYLDAIDKTDSPAQQKKLNDLMQQETNYLREQDKLSAYDLERANLKYELALKQMALEEAQQNKTQLRLRRDSQGNYTYQYTQDDDQVASIQSEIANLYNQLYNLDAEQYKGNLEEIYSIWNEFQERMAEAAQINDPEQRAAKELLIKQQYSDLINGLVEKNENLQANLYQSTMSHLFDLYDQNAANYADMSEDQKAILDMFINAETDLTGAAFDNMFDLYNINIEQFKNMTDEQKDILMSSMIPQWDSGVQQMTDKIAGEGGFIPTCKDAFEELDKATEDYMTGLEELQKNADVSFEDVKNGINDVIVETEELLKDNGELIGTYEKELLAIKGVIDELDILIKKYQDAELAAKAATEEAYKYWQQEQNKNAEVDANLDKPEENKPAPTNNTPVVSAPAEPAKPSLAKGSYVEVKPGTRWYADSYGGGGSGYARAGTIKYTSSGPYGYNIGGLGWVRKTDIVGYDTGGYTGEWSNNNGRLAMLHQKELVLNANDTANMLSAITILRDITANLGATLLNKMASISAGNPGSIGQGLAAAGMEQNVVINAEFPNATNSREIEDALNNLVNRASQHIQRN